MDEARFADSMIESKVSEGKVWIDAKALTEHLCNVSWNVHDGGFEADASVIATIGKWVESCTVNAMVDATLDMVQTDGPEAAAALVMELSGLNS